MSEEAGIEEPLVPFHRDLRDLNKDNEGSSVDIENSPFSIGDSSNSTMTIESVIRHSRNKRNDLELLTLQIYNIS
jgi:hypothetical protein